MDTLPYDRCDVIPESPVTGDELPPRETRVDTPVDNSLAAKRSDTIVSDDECDSTDNAAGVKVTGEKYGAKVPVDDLSIAATQAYIAVDDDRETDDEGDTAGKSDIEAHPRAQVTSTE